jgi:hypothetical protein
MAKLVDIPIAISDCTTLTQSGNPSIEAHSDSSQDMSVTTLKLPYIGYRLTY